MIYPKIEHFTNRMLRQMVIRIAIESLLLLARLRELV